MKNGKYSKEQLLEKLDFAIKSGQEATNYDFKREWTKKIFDETILAMLNIIENEDDAFVFIGVDDKTKEIIGLSELKDENCFNNHRLNENANYCIDNIYKGEKAIQVISIFNRYNKPYFKIGQDGRMSEVIRIRKNSASLDANPQEIEELYKYRLGVDDDIRTKLVKSLLIDMNGWFCQHSISSRNIEAYYLKNPDYKVIAVAQTFSTGDNKKLGYIVDLVYNTTTIVTGFLMIEYDKNSILVPTFLKEKTNIRNGIHYNVLLVLNTAIKKEQSILEKKQYFEDACKEKNIIWIDPI